MNYWDCFPYEFGCDEVLPQVQGLTSDPRATEGLLCDRFPRSAEALYRPNTISGVNRVQGSFVLVVGVVLRFLGAR